MQSADNCFILEASSLSANFTGGTIGSISFLMLEMCLLSSDISDDGRAGAHGRVVLTVTLHVWAHIL